MKRPQLSLRELFLLLALAAMGCGWWVDRTRYVNWYVPTVRLQESYDVGDVAQNADGTCELRIDNVGRVPVFVGAGPSERGIQFIPPNATLQAGETGSVHFYWRAGVSRGPFKLTSHLHTNDPSQPDVEVTIIGNVVPRARNERIKWNCDTATFSPPSHRPVARRSIRA